jgi:hypothetical protein
MVLCTSTWDGILTTALPVSCLSYSVTSKFLAKMLCKAPHGLLVGRRVGTDMLPWLEEPVLLTGRMGPTHRDLGRLRGESG